MDLVVDATRIHASTGGRPFAAAGKPGMILIHGAGMDHTVWTLIARAFAFAGTPVLAVDLPGHGRSEGNPLAGIGEAAAWVGRFMDAAGMPSAILVGHSMGAAIALEAGALLGPRVTGLGLLGIAASMAVHPALLEAADKDPPRAHAMMTGWSLAPAARVGGNAAPGMWMSGATMALLARARPGVLARDLAACNAWTSGLDAARRITCTTYVIMGELDLMTPPRKARELIAAIAGAKAVTIVGAGHMMMQESPDATLDALLAAFAAKRQLAGA